MKANKVSFNVLCALALCVICVYLGYFFRSIQNNCILEDQSCLISHTQSLTCDENYEYYTVLNRFLGSINPENLIDSRCVSCKTGRTDNTILANWFEKAIMRLNVREINIWEHTYDTAKLYRIENLRDSLWLSSDKDTICIPSSWWTSLANEVKHTPTDSISLDRMNIQEEDIQRFDSLLNSNKLPGPFFLSKPLSATDVIEKMRKSLPALNLGLNIAIEIQFVDARGGIFTAVNSSNIILPDGYIWTFSYNGCYFRYHGLAFQELIRNCISPDSPLYHKLEKEMMLLNLNATCWGEDVCMYVVE
ncbi:MAG: hypothetical protein K6F48_05165 [Paludibacteraceae bacterium]|nr:hypothetical protein [Paludibacteraceae bacterium]